MANLQGWEDVIRDSIGDSYKPILGYLPDDGVFYDIGANVGAFTDRILSVKPNAYCVLFEPLKEFYDYMVTKYEGNPNIKIYNVALVESDRDLQMSACGNNLGWNTISEIQVYGTQHTVKGTTLSNIVEFENIRLPDVIKIDVELSEHLVIEGAKDLIQKHTPKALHIEIGILPTNTLWEKEEAMIQYLFSLGYKEYDYKIYTGTYDALFAK